MNAVIYCRVSSKDQVEGTSLESQQAACLDYAQRNNLTVSRVFIEEGESAKFADRTQLLELLSYCKGKSHQIEALIVWKVDRFARNVEDHYSIKAALRKVGVRVISVTEPIDNDPNGKLMETILAGFAQFDNDIRALRTIQGLKQRLKEGIFPWKPPLGYLPPKIGKKVRPDLPDPESFEIIKNAWKLFASGGYAKADILRLLRSQGLRPYRGGQLHAQLLDHMFANPYYAGILSDPWTGEQYAGRHPAMVTPTEFARVQQLVKEHNRSEPHHRARPEFPLRGLVRCPSCQAYLTGAFSQGRCKRYPYYNCYKRNCPTRTKSYPAAAVHDEFTSFLKMQSVPEVLVRPIVNEILELSADENAAAKQAASRHREEETRLERRLSELILMRTSQLVSDAEFSRQRDIIRKQVLACQANRYTLQSKRLTESDARELADSLNTLDSLWPEIPIAERRVFGELLVPAGYVFTQIRTADSSLLFRVFGVPEERESDVVPFIKQNLNALLADIQRFLAIVRRAKVPHRKAA